MNSFAKKMGLLVAGVACSASLHAEDIDLFVANPPSGAEAPNVLIIFDTTANWTQAYANEKAALASVVSGLPENKFRLGLMMFTETGSGDSGADGAYVRAAIRPMDATNKTVYQNLVTSLDRNGDKGNGAKMALSMEEAFLYFSAGTPYAGNNKNKTDYLGSTYGTAASQAVYARPNNALNSKGGVSYNTPIASGCAKNFIIYISNGAATDNSSDKSQANGALAALGGSTTPIAISPAGLQDNPADEWSRFMKKHSLGITTYTVEIDRVATGQGPNMTALMQSAARVSSGKYFSVSSSGSGIVDALNAIFSEIQSTNSVFASVSLPVSVNTQGTYLNQVFVGMFRPDGNALPRWLGNLKQYRLGLIGSDLKLLDARATPTSAINTGTGFVSECAQSYWTPGSTLNESYWAFSPRGGCLQVPGSDVSDYPDGNIVEKGAQAYVMRKGYASVLTAGLPGRTVLTCSSTFASCDSAGDPLISFDTGNADIAAAKLGSGVSSTDRDNIINWARGQDVKDSEATENGNANTTEARSSIHGDVVHSRPVAINYGTDANPSVVVFYGANDGALRAVNGNRSNSIGAVQAGGELWSFIPPEFMAQHKRLYDNSTAIDYPGIVTAPSAPTPLPKPYGFDGPVAAYKDASSAAIFATMRRGGRALYAFNVTDPDSPTLKWKVGCPNNFPVSGGVDDTGCSAGFSGIGQTWSSPKVIKAAGYSAGASPLLIMGGGYDTCEDADPHACTATSKGNKVYVLDANTGVLQKTFTTSRSVIADITVINNSSGLAIYAYVVDLGGNLYRINISTDTPTDWTMTPVAELGCSPDAGGAHVSTCATNRKFMFAPDVVEDLGGYVVLMGTGDREKPLLSYDDAAATSNYFFMVKDHPQDSTWLPSQNTMALCGKDVICQNSLTAILDENTPTDADLAASKGWYLGLTSTEQVVTSAITVFGVVTFSTHQPFSPVSGLCASLGETKVYNISYINAEGEDGIRSHDLAGDGLPPSPVAGMVTLDDGTTVPFVIGANPDSPLEGSPPVTPPAVNQPTSRVYWNIEH